MEWTKVESTQIAEVGFEHPETLGMRFLKKDGSVSEYTYAGVPFRMYREMLTAKSIGIWFRDNIKDKKDNKGDLLYPYTKVEPERPIPAAPVVSGEQASMDFSTGQQNGDTSAGTALARVDNLKASEIFVPGAMDKLLQEIREQALAEVAGLNISTPKMRDAIKKTKNKVVKSRTFIERMRVSYVSAEKKRLATVDEESRRIQDILRGIEDEVAAPLIEWESKEQDRIDAHSSALKGIEAMQPHMYPDIPSLTTAIALLEETGPEKFEEFSVPVEHAKEDALDRLRTDLDRRQKAEAERVELDRLRAESASRAEQDRLAAAAKEAREQAEREASAERVRIEGEKAAAEQRAKDAEARAEADKIEAERKAKEAAEQAARDRIAAVEAERKRAADEQAKVDAERVKREQDKAHREEFDGEVVEALMGCALTRDEARGVLLAVAKGLIPHVTINY